VKAAFLNGKNKGAIMTEIARLKKQFKQAARAGAFLQGRCSGFDRAALDAEIAAKTCWLCGGPINTRPLTAKSVASVYLRADAEARLLAEIAAGETPTVSASDFLAICGGCMRRLTRTRQKAEEGLKNAQNGASKPVY
jgi:hypothetical protein